MKKTDALTKGLAVTGAVLAWLPIAAPFVFSVLSLLADGRFRFDFLMPAELFPVAFVGGLLLFWAAVRARSRRGLIGWGVVLAAALLVASQGLAVVTGLASGEIEPAGWPLALVVALLAGYSLTLVAIGVGGILLARDILRQGRPESHG